MMEFQLTKEYLGFATHLVYLAPLFEEVLKSDTLAKGAGSTVAKVIDGSLHRLLSARAWPASRTSALIATGPARSSIRRTGTPTAAARAGSIVVVGNDRGRVGPISFRSVRGRLPRWRARPAPSRAGARTCT